jgi:hypothetical protein
MAVSYVSRCIIERRARREMHGPRLGCSASRDGIQVLVEIERVVA